MIGRKSGFDSIAAGELGGNAGILAKNFIGTGERGERSERDIAQITDRRRGDMKTR